MNKFITTLLGLVILTVLVICAMNMLGLGDLVSDAGNAIREKAGTAPRVQTQVSKEPDDFASKTLGWDVREVQKKPVATVKKGIALLEDKIDELERLREEIKYTARQAGRAKEKFNEELDGLRETLRNAKAKLTDPNTQYPLKIKTYTYSNREMLLASFSKMNARYQSLTNASTYSVNNPERAIQQELVIDRQIRAARSAMDLLKAKLTTAEIMELENATAKTEDELQRVTVPATTIINEPVDLPVGPATVNERNEREVLDFND